MPNRATAGEATVGSLNVSGVKVKSLVANLSGSLAASELTIGRLPANAVVTDVYARVDTAPTATTASFHIGTLSSASGGDADGFAVNLAVNSAGVKVPSLAGATAAVRTLGALLTETVTAASAEPHPARVHAWTGSVARDVTITPLSAFTGFLGKVVIRYIEV